MWNEDNKVKYVHVKINMPWYGQVYVHRVENKNNVAIKDKKESTWSEKGKDGHKRQELLKYGYKVNMKTKSNIANTCISVLNNFYICGILIW